MPLKEIAPIIFSMCPNEDVVEVKVLLSTEVS